MKIARQSLAYDRFVLHNSRRPAHDPYTQLRSEYYVIDANIGHLETFSEFGSVKDVFRNRGLRRGPAALTVLLATVVGEATLCELARCWCPPSPTHTSTRSCFSDHALDEALLHKPHGISGLPSRQRPRPTSPAYGDSVNRANRLWFVRV